LFGPAELPAHPARIIAMHDNAVIIADAQGVIRFWSAGAEARFGHAAGDSVGKMLDLIVPEEYRVQHWAGFHRAVAAGRAGIEGQVNPFPVVTASGAVVPTPGRLTLLRDADDTVIGAMVVFG
jgi:PAS domain S-box-containing protein